VCSSVLLLLLLLQGVDYLFSPELSGVVDSSKCTTCMDPNSTACSGTGLDAGAHGALAVLNLLNLQMVPLHSQLQSQSQSVQLESVHLRACIDACFQTYVLPYSTCQLLLTPFKASWLSKDAATAALQMLLTWQRVWDECSPSADCIWL
jgi:hypothetical protein